jgi:hypothetical protein
MWRRIALPLTPALRQAQGRLSPRNPRVKPGEGEGIAPSSVGSQPRPVDESECDARHSVFRGIML